MQGSDAQMLRRMFGQYRTDEIATALNVIKSVHDAAELVRRVGEVNPHASTVITLGNVHTAFQMVDRGEA